MTVVLDIVKRALGSVTGSRYNEVVNDVDQVNDAFAVLNEMVDQWSNDHMLIFTQQEIILELISGQFIYTIGPGGSVGSAFTASLSGNVLTVTALASGAMSVGQIISGTGVPANCAITSYGTAVGGNGTGAIGTYYVNLAPSVPVTSESMTGYQPRPLRITSAIVRVVNSVTGTLDYPVAVLAYEEYQLIGIKTLPIPWPRAMYYQPTMPLGLLQYWGNPSQGEMHMYADTVLNQFASTSDTVILPQGYVGALRWSLAELLMADYGELNEIQVGLITKQAAKGRALVKKTNMHPQMPARYDDMLQVRTRKDASFILHGGFS